MYLHIGLDTIIKREDVIGIFDLDTSTVSKATRNYLTKAEKDGKVITVGYELPKSFILTENKKDGDKIYISQISSSTLLKRAQSSAVIFDKNSK